MVRGQGNESHRCALPRFQRQPTLHPEKTHRQLTAPSDVPHGSKPSSRKYRHLAASLLSGQEAELGPESTVPGLAAPPLVPEDLRFKPHHPGGISQQFPELRRLRAGAAELFKQKKGQLPFAVFQVLQRIGDAGTGLGPDGWRTELSSPHQ